MTDRSGRGLVNADFVPKRGWVNPHLQTIRSRVVPTTYLLPGSEEILQVALTDGTGDRLAVSLHRPDAMTRRITVLLIHGLGGSAESDYVRAATRGLLLAGHSVARVDLRGAGRSARISAHLYHGGRTEDLRTVTAALSRCDGVGAIAPVGFSLGGNAVLKLLGEPHPGTAVVAGAAVSAPLDLAAGSPYLRRAAFGVYERFLVRKIRADALRPGARFTPEERSAILASRTLVEFDDAVTAPRHGWRDAEEYYAVNSSLTYLPRIRVPTLVIHAIDDPMVSPQPYRRVAWEELAARGPVRRAITPHGGHVGFHEEGNSLPWYVHPLGVFLAEVE